MTISDQPCEKAECFSVHSVALDEATDITDTAQLAIYGDGSSEGMEELLAGIPMHGHTTAEEMFHQLCEAIEQRFVVPTTDGAPSMTGRENGLVALEEEGVEEELEEEGVEEAIALPCIIHQQALCSRWLKFDCVMSAVVKCINQIRSRGLKRRRSRAFLRVESRSERRSEKDLVGVPVLSNGLSFSC